MKPPIVIIGIGELGSEFARGFMRCGFPTYPVTRHMSIAQQAQAVPDPALVLVAVPENQLDPVLSNISDTWKERLCLIQNELLPPHWQQHNIENPTVAVVWFEKKPGLPLRNILYSPVYGPHAYVVTQALDEINIPTKNLSSSTDLIYELLRKSLYIFTVNICGLVENTSVKELWYHNTALANDVAHEIISILQTHANTQLPADKLIKGMIEGIDDCPDRKCLGRRANDRLKRALQHANTYQLSCPRLTSIAASIETRPL